MKKNFYLCTFFFNLFLILFAAQDVRAEKIYTSKFLRKLAEKAAIFSPERNGSKAILLGSGSESTAYLMQLEHRFANQDGYVAVKLANQDVLDRNDLRTAQYIFATRLEGQRQLQQIGWKYAAIDDAVKLNSKDIPLIQRYIEGPTVSTFLSEYRNYGIDTEVVSKFAHELNFRTNNINYQLRQQLRKAGVDAHSVQLGNLDLNPSNLIIKSKTLNFFKLTKQQLDPIRDAIVIDW
ncbi:MAG: hypothetical protein J0L93_00510 [Deltaproteobacteria bacterium]|nr:hypothetical protein [Deltaproteobacteria bacterium]